MPKAPSSSMTSSPRPKANPTYQTPAKSKTAQSTTVSKSASNSDNQGQGKTTSTKKPAPTTGSAKPIVPQQPNAGTPNNPRQPDTPAKPAPGNNPNLPADQVQAQRGERRPDRSLIDALQQPGANRSAQKYRGSVLSTVYKVPTDPAKSAKTLQQFNGPRGQKMTLGG